MFEPMSIAKLVVFYTILLAVTSLKLDDLIRDLKKITLLNKKEKNIRGLK